MTFDLFSHLVSQTLAHFLWQGLAIGLVCAAVMRALADRSPARFVVGVAGLLAMAAAPLVTFALLMPEASPAPVAAAIVADIAPEPPVPAANRLPVVAVTWPIEAPAPGPKYEHWVAGCWSIGVLLFAARLLVGVAGVYRWSWPRTELPAELREAAHRLMAAMGVAGARIFANARVPDALVLGVWRPIVLVPAAWLTELPMPMLEAVIAHELAHLRRHDLVWNALQRLVETFLFFHPAVWWLSARVRQERELCCDALAVEATGDRLMYARTLERVAGFPPATAGAVGMGGRPMSLLHRVQMVLGMTPRPAPHSWPVGVAIAAVVVAVAVAFVALQPAETQADDDTDQIRVTVAADNGKPVPGIPVHAIRHGELLRTFRTDAKGQLRIPTEWRLRHQPLTLWTRHEDRVGWHSLESHFPKADVTDISLPLMPFRRQITGQLVDEKGAALPDIEITMISATDPRCGELNLYTNPPLVGEAAGLVSLPWAKTDAAGKFALKAFDVENAIFVVRNRQLAAAWIMANKKTTDVGKVVAPPGSLITGKIVDESGRPVAQGAVAALRHYLHGSPVGSYAMARSDANGQYTLMGLVEGHYSVEFYGTPVDRQIVPARVLEKRVQTAMVHALDVPVMKGRRLTGRTVDSETGKPLPWMPLQYGGPQTGPRPVATSDREGGFELFVAPGETTIRIINEASWRVADHKRTVEVPADRDFTGLVLYGRTRPTLQEQLNEGKAKISPAPVDPDYRLKLELRPPPDKVVGEVSYRLIHDRRTVSVQGRFTGPHCDHPLGATLAKQRPTQLLIDAAGYAPVLTREFEISKRMEPLVVELTPETIVPVRGRVLGVDGKPLAGARVRVGRFMTADDPEFPWGAETTTAGDGTFTIQRARVGEKLYVYAERDDVGGVKSDRFPIEKPGPVQLPDLRIPRADQVLEGKVVRHNRSPAAGVTVNAHVRNPETPSRIVGRATTDERGQFRIEGLPPGELWLDVVSAKDRLPYPHEASAGAKDLIIPLVPIPDPSRKPKSLTVTLRTPDGGEVEGDAWWMEVGEPHWSLQRGKLTRLVFNDAAVKPGATHALAVIARGFAMPKPLVVKPDDFGRDVTIDLTPAAPVAVAGRVVDDAGAPLAGVQVGLSRTLAEGAVYDEWRYGTVAATTDAQGRFRIGDLPPGLAVSVFVNKAGFAGAQSPSVTLAAEDHSYGDIRLPASRRTITGIVVDARDRPVAGAKVATRHLGDVRTTSGADGRFRLDAAPHGRILLVADAEDEPLGYADVADGKTEARIRLESR